MDDLTKEVIDRNLCIFNKVCKSDPLSLRKVKQGNWEFFAIDAYPQIKMATALFGPMGIGFGLDKIDWQIVAEMPYRLSAKDRKAGVEQRFGPLLVFFCEFWYRHPFLDQLECRFPLHNNIEILVNDDFMKKVYTDTLTKGLSYLGFNYDVFEGKFDDNRYAGRPETGAPQWMIQNLRRLAMLVVENGGNKEAIDKMLLSQTNTGFMIAGVTNCIVKLKENLSKANIDYSSILIDDNSEVNKGEDDARIQQTRDVNTGKDVSNSGKPNSEDRKVSETGQNDS